MRGPMSISTQNHVSARPHERLTDEGRGSDRGLQQRYDEFVSKSPQSSIYCNRWWLDAVAPNRYQILTVGKNGNIDAAWTIVFDETRERIVMPPMTQKLGVMFAPNSKKYSEALSREHRLVEELIEQLPDVAVETRCHENFTNWLPFYWHGFTQRTRYTYVIPDLSDSDRIWSGMQEGCRRNIRRARKQGVSIVNDLPFERFLDLHDKTYERQGMMTPVSRELIGRIDEACQRHAGRKIIGCQDGQGRLHAAVWVAWHNGTAYYLMMGSDPELRRSGAGKLVMWEAIRFCSTVADRFDFEGSMMRNVERAFRSFGAIQTTYFEIRRSGRPTLKGIARTTLGQVRWWAGGSRANSIDGRG